MHFRCKRIIFTLYDKKRHAVNIHNRFIELLFYVQFCTFALLISIFALKLDNMKKQTKVTLATRLKEARDNKGLSQQELGKLAKVHYTNIGRYERGDSSPSSDVLNKIAKALEVSPDYLMNGTLDNKANDTLKDERLLIQFKKIEQLPMDRKNLLIEFLDGFIFKSSVQQLS